MPPARPDSGTPIPSPRSSITDVAAGASSLSSAQPVPAAPRIHDRQWGSLFDAQEILIAGDEELGPTRQCRGEHPGVIRIAQRDLGGGRRSSDDGVGAELVLNESDLGGRHLEPLVQDPAELREIDFPSQQLVLGNDETKQISAEPAGREGADEDVRVEEDLHDTSRKTSSSVR